MENVGANKKKVFVGLKCVKCKRKESERIRGSKICKKNERRRLGRKFETEMRKMLAGSGRKKMWE